MKNSNIGKRTRIASAVKQARNTYGMTQKDFGEKIFGVRGQTIGYWEKGDVLPGGDHLLTLAEIRGDNVERFLKWINEGILETDETNPDEDNEDIGIELKIAHFIEEIEDEAKLWWLLEIIVEKLKIQSSILNK